MHNALKVVCGRESWFAEPTFLKKDELDKVTEARTRLSNDGKKAPTVDQIVAELTFGFWASLLDDRYKKTTIVNCIDLVFPNIPYRKRDRETMLSRIERVRRLRNRVFHHEPIWHWSNLAEHHDLVFNVLAGIDESKLFSSGGSLQERPQREMGSVPRRPLQRLPNPGRCRG